MATIVLIGASGTIGQAVADRLAQQYNVIRVSHARGEHTVDLGDKQSIETLFSRIDTYDAVVCAAGQSRFAALAQAGDDDFAISIAHKLMGQVNVARIALGRLPAGGSITLTTGLLARAPMPGTVPTAMVNAALEGFVRAAALDMTDNRRINAVSPIFVTATAERMGMPAAGTMSAGQTAKAYEAAVAGKMNGEVLDVRDYGSVV